MQVKRRLSIRATDLVLDVGSGNLPHPLASVLVDRYGEDSSQRLGGPLAMDRPVVIADVERLPFPDKAFDYVVASHVLEHTSDPIAAARELSRVSRRGYVETPTEIWELLCGWEFHTFVAYLDQEGVVVFKRKSRREPLLGRLSQRLGECEPLFADLIQNHPELFFVSFEWEGHIPCRLSAETWPESLETATFIERLQPTRPPLAQGVRTLARALLPGLRERHRRHAARLGLQPPRPERSRARGVDLEAAVACPGCRHTPLIWQSAVLVCSGCGNRYERNGGIPILLLPADKAFGVREQPTIAGIAL